MPSVSVRRVKRLTPLPALGPLYLVLVVICGALVLEALIAGRYAEPRLIPLLIIFGAAYGGCARASTWWASSSCCGTGWAVRWSP
ncbi:hypothetical protein ACFQZ4_47875 [Catellatospora coxensis]